MKKPIYADIPLVEPLTIGGKEVTSIRLRRPQPGETRGLSLTQLLQMNVDAMMAVLPRISEPPLDRGTLATMDLSDFAELAGQVVLFFDRKAPTMQEPIGEDGPTT